jgi:hypothetical protein
LALEDKSSEDKPTISAEHAAELKKFDEMLTLRNRFVKLAHNQGKKEKDEMRKLERKRKKEKQRNAKLHTFDQISNIATSDHTKLEDKEKELEVFSEHM